MARRRSLSVGSDAIWHDGLQDIPVRILSRGRDACGIYVRVEFQCADGSVTTDTVHPSQVRSAARSRSRRGGPS